MTDLIVIYENGVLKPNVPLALTEGQQVQIRILESESAENRLDKALQNLVSVGALTNPVDNFSDSLPEINIQLRTNPEIESHGFETISANPLSDIIIQDRGNL